MPKILKKIGKKWSAHPSVEPEMIKKKKDKSKCQKINLAQSSVRDYKKNKTLKNNKMCEKIVGTALCQRWQKELTEKKNADIF